MENIGALALLLAFCFAVYAILGSLVGKWGRRPFLTLSAERAGSRTTVELQGGSHSVGVPEAASVVDLIREAAAAAGAPADG